VFHFGFDQFLQLIVELAKCILGGSESIGQGGNLLRQMICPGDGRTRPFKELDGFVIVLYESDGAQPLLLHGV
jgi:hypothetical protein